MNAEDLAGILEDADHRFELPAVWLKREWFPVARDRVGTYAAVTSIQRSGAKHFFGAPVHLGVKVNAVGRW
jgi:hypothetical protein